LKTNDNINNLRDKLLLLGLDMENIPDKLKTFSNINFKVHKNYDERKYKVYKYIDINEVEIFLTPTNRLTDYTEKYAKALPIGEFLNSNTELELERQMQFLKLVKEFQKEELENLENQQLQFSKTIPYNVKFNKDYLWQIYYSEVSKKYFMLVPIKESECTALFYALKKQLKDQPKKVYVPICYANYSNKFFNTSQIDEIERYLCYFTKEWPSIYEIHDKNEDISMRIVGKANIYDTIQTEYKIQFDNQEEAENFYKILKVLFMLATQLATHYRFNLKLDKSGSLHFVFEDKEITYNSLLDFIKSEYIKGLETTIKSKEAKINLEKKLKKLKKLSKELDQEYFEKEKQISTFLECKKTFLGKVKYFIKYKKKSLQVASKNLEEIEEGRKLKYCERMEMKDSYTLEELLELYSKLDEEIASIKDIELDIEAVNKRIDILQAKIKNATLYIKEIDKHKKSIFEFWKFTNKDEAKQLNEGIIEIKRTKKIKKAFNFEQDFEDIAKQFDKTARAIYTKEETDSIFIATTSEIENINLIAKNEEISEEELIKLKNQKQKEDLNTSFDIFGSASDSREQIKHLGNIKHRENEKNKFAILKIKEETTKEEYAKTMKQIYEDIEKSMGKFKNTLEMPIYKAGELQEGLNIFYINPESALKEIKEKETNLYKIILKEKESYIPLTNIMYYNNTSKTLPLGMHVTDGILINTKNMDREFIKTSQNYIVKSKGDSPIPETIKINIYE